MIKRNLFSEILSLMEIFPVVGIIGPRQCGKTTLARSFLNKIGKECIYLDLESPIDRSKLSDPETFFIDNQDKCIVLDEIQRMSELFPILRSVIDRYRVNGRFVILGSVNPGIMRDSSESLAGRIAYKELTPFNITELLFEDYKKHWLRGGFPKAYLYKKDSSSKIWLDNFITTYIERDLPQLGLNISNTVLRNLWTMIANSHGDIFNANNFARSLGLTSATIKRYTNFLEEAFLIYSLKPFYINIKKRIVKSPKIYIRDSGVLHSLTNSLDADRLPVSIIVGASWEGYVIEQIRQLVDRNFELFFYRTHHGTECDLVLVKGLKPVAAIEIKYTSAPSMTKGFTLSIEDLGTENNFIITPQSDDYLIRKNIRVCNMKDFITNYLAEL